MTKGKTNALEALRGLISERQQYEQWISNLESKRDGSPAHVFEKVHGDYNTRLQRVITEIKGHAEELQLSISALSSRLVEVAREEDIRRDALEEAKLRAEVGEFEPQQWDQLRTEAERGLEKVAADRASLDSQLGELRSIQKLSEVGSVGDAENVVRAPVSRVDGSTARDMMAGAAPASPVDANKSSTVLDQQPTSNVDAKEATSVQVQAALPLDSTDASQPAPAAAQPAPAHPTTSPPASVPNTPRPTPASGQRPRTGKTPPFGGAPVNPKPPEPRVDQSKTLKCPECGTPNYPTEWYCERCGGELATM